MKHHVMDLTGHSTIEFDPAIAADLAEAMDRFEKLTTTGYRAATRQLGATDYTVIKQFGQLQDETLFVPAMAGG